MNIVYAGNNNVYKGMLLGTLSLLKHHKTPLNIYILTMTLTEVDKDYIEVSDEDIKSLEELVKKVNSASSVKKIDVKELYLAELKDSPNAQSRYTAYTLLRLLLDKIEGMPNKLFYLDTDTLVNGSLLEMYNTDLTGYEFAGARDRYGRFFFNPRYLNAGVLLFNLEYMKTTGLLQKCRDYLNEKKVFLSDQTALNRKAKSKKILPMRINEQKRVKANTLIRHFSNQIRLFPKFHLLSVKPWDIERLHTIYKCHDFDDILLQYQTNKGANLK